MFDVLMKVPKQRMVFKFKHNEIDFCNIEKNTLTTQMIKDIASISYLTTGTA